MGGANKLLIIQEKTKPTALVSYTGSENDFFFSQDYLSGNIEKALATLIQESKEFHENSYASYEKLTLSPFHYGMNVIDFTTKTIHTMNGYDMAGLKTLMSFLVMQENKMRELIEGNLAQIYFAKENKKYLLKDFLGTTDAEKGFNLLKTRGITEKQLIKNRLDSNGIISQYTTNIFSNSFDCFLLPHNFDFEVKVYSENANNNTAHELFINLYQNGIEFNNQDLKGWYKYLEKSSNNSNNEPKDKIKEFLKMTHEKQKLETMIKEKSINKTKNKL